MKSMVGIAVISLGLILVVVGVFLLKDKRELVAEKTGNKLPVKQEVRIANADKPIAGNVSIKNSYEESKRKGDEFEKYVVQKFNKEYFALKEWTSDKFVNGTYPENSLGPDLLYQFSLAGISEGLAIECKWRSKLSNNYQVVTNQQLKNYRNFGKERNLPVFLIIGVGGNPSSPERLYIIPLNKIQSEVINESLLKEFEQETKRNFFYDYKTKSLTAKSFYKEKEQA